MDPTSEHLNILKQILTNVKGEKEDNTIIMRLQYSTFSNVQIIQTEMDMNHTLDQMNLTDIDRYHSIQHQQNTYSSALHMEYSPE